MLSLSGTRTTSATVTFMRPFRLGHDPRELPPGGYIVHTQEEVYEGAFGPLFLAVSIDLEVPERRGKSFRVIKPEDLARAIAGDETPHQEIM